MLEFLPESFPWLLRLSQPGVLLLGGVLSVFLLIAAVLILKEDELKKLTDLGLPMVGKGPNPDVSKCLDEGTKKVRLRTLYLNLLLIPEPVPKLSIYSSCRQGPNRDTSSFCDQLDQVAPRIRDLLRKGSLRSSSSPPRFNQRPESLLGFDTQFNQTRLDKKY